MPIPVKGRKKTSKQNNELYVHYSPPKVLQLNSAHIKQLIRNGDVDKLEQIVIEGHGKRLIGEYSADYKTRTFLKNVPALMTKISLLHDAVNSGRLEELQTLIEEEHIDKRKKLVMSKDDFGVGLLHKSVYYDLRNIYKYLIEKFPHIVSLKDGEGRTAFHYTPMCKDVAGVQKLLISAGADSSVSDSKQHNAKYYMNHVQELELPTPQKATMNSGRSGTSQESLNFKKSNIRIWIHQRNLTNLQQVVWEGHGPKLLVEHSNNPKIKKFLEAVPHIMGLIKDIHIDVVNDELDSLKKHTSEPTPSIVLSGKDSNGLTPLHKAAGLGKQDIAEYIVSRNSKCVDITDSEGRTPLHYAAPLKDDGKMTNFLLENGADESVLDNKQKTAAYYKNRPSELDSKLLSVIPECPRTAKESFLANFDWSLLTVSTPIEEIHKGFKKAENNNTEKGNGEDKGTPREEKSPPIENNNHEEEDQSERLETDTNHINGENEIADEKTEVETADINTNEKIIAKEGDETEQNDNATEQNEGTEEETETKSNEEIEKEDEVKEKSHESRSTSPEKSKVNEQSDEKEDRPRSNISENKSRPTSGKINDVNKDDLEEHPITEIEPEGVIEGVVNGENEVETLNEEGQDVAECDDNSEDSEIAALIEAGNMEQLATLVLNGEGKRLVGQTSNNTELQSFLDNVQIYMSKINRIHVAAREGSLRDLQAALDRRKFAIAKDEISPNGASPLHTAVIFGNTSIVRYLAGRFPETAQVTDSNGRTPLHYAAVLMDNGHYYNLLLHLGADSRTKDKFGNTPEYYRIHQDEFSHKSILREFGAEDSIADEMLNDKVPNDTYSARKDLDDYDMVNVLERCYNVLHGRRTSNVSAASTSSSGTQANHGSSVICKHTRRCIFDTIKMRLTKLDHNLYDVIWPSVKKLPAEMSFRVALEQDFPAGIVAPDFYAYKVFAEYIEPIIKEYNAIDAHFELGIHPPTKFAEQEDGKNIEIEFDLDPQSRWIISGNVVPSNANSQVDMPFFATEEGRYLASSLGDPLIKGLTEVANKRPEDPIAYLATYLYNFANNRQNLCSRGKTQENQRTVAGSPQDVDNNNAVPASIDVVTVDPEDSGSDEDSAFNSTSRDEHGQSMLHFAAARAHGRNALFQLLIETEINVAYRDELYRTARDISIQANILDNTQEIDRYVMTIATKGDTDKLVELLLDGYDHITDIIDDNDVPIVEAVAQHNQSDTVSFLQSILAFEEKRERVHHAIRMGSINEVTALLADENDTGSGKLLAIGKNSYGRCSLHIAVLCQQEEIVDYLANSFPDTLKLGDNLERTALHYAMGVEQMETITRVLIKAGSKRIVKDLKGRQPTYYFLNKSDILRLQEEEETF